MSDPALQRLAARVVLGIGDAVERDALEQLGGERPGRRAAALLLARDEAAAILAGERPPQEGAERIWDLTVRAHPDRAPELDAFVYAASEWRERPEDGDHFAAAVREAARDLLAA